MWLSTTRDTVDPQPASPEARTVPRLFLDIVSRVSRLVAASERPCSALLTRGVDKIRGRRGSPLRTSTAGWPACRDEHDSLYAAVGGEPL
jgi:hypothetical protein